MSHCTHCLTSFVNPNVQGAKTKSAQGGLPQRLPQSPAQQRRRSEPRATQTGGAFQGKSRQRSHRRGKSLVSEGLTPTRLGLPRRDSLPPSETCRTRDSFKKRVSGSACMGGPSHRVARFRSHDVSTWRRTPGQTARAQGAPKQWLNAAANSHLSALRPPPPLPHPTPAPFKPRPCGRCCAG